MPHPLSVPVARARARKAESANPAQAGCAEPGAEEGAGIAWTEVYAVVECRSERTRADGCGRASTRKNL